MQENVSLHLEANTAAFPFISSGSQCQHLGPGLADSELLVVIWMAIMEISILPLNFIIGFMFMKRKELLLIMPRNKLVFSLSIAGLLISVLVLPWSLLSTAMSVTWLPDDEFLCQFVGFCYLTLFSVVVTTLTLLAYDRYVCILYPLRYPVVMTPLRMNLNIVYAWVLSTITGLLPLFGWCEYSYSCVEFLCSPTWSSSPSFAAYFCVVHFLCPTLLGLWSHIHVLRVARKQSRFGRRMSRVAIVPLEIARILHETSSSKTMKTSIVIFGFYLLCWTPHICAILIECLYGPTTRERNRILLPILYLLKYPMLVGFPYVFVFRARGLRRQMNLFLSELRRNFRPARFERNHSTRQSNTKSEVLKRTFSSELLDNSTNAADDISYSRRSTKRVSFQIGRGNSSSSNHHAPPGGLDISRVISTELNSNKTILSQESLLPGQVQDISTGC